MVGNNMFEPAFCKRKSFKHESEVRAMVFSCHKSDPTDFHPWGDGTLVSIDIETLIEAVYVSPNSSRLLEESVKAIVDRFGLKCPITRSDLNSFDLY